VGIGHGEDIVSYWLDRALHPRRRQPGDRRSAANEAGRFVPSVLISVHSRFPIEVNRFQKVRHHEPGPRVRQRTTSS
jgi:hypothetical protein